MSESAEIALVRTGGNLEGCQAEQKLLVAAQEWRASIDAISEEICLLDLDGGVRRCNRAMRQRLQKPYGEIVGRPCDQVVCAGCGCNPQCPFLRLRETRRRETGSVTLDGRVYDMTAEPVLDDSGVLRGAVLVLADITEGRRAETLHRMLMDSIPSSVLLLDESLRVVLVNRNFLEKSRRARSETLGKRITEVFPDVILAETRLAAELRGVFADSQPLLGQRLRYSVPGLPHRIYYYSIIPVSWGARSDHVLLLMDDVTEQTRMSEEIRRMERHLASVVESASDIVFSTDAEGRILTWNKAAERISGYSREEVSGRCFFEYCDEGGSQQLRPFFKGARGADSPGIECDLITKEGKRRHVSWVFSPLVGDLHRTAGVVAVGRDLTERRKFEMQLLRSQKMAALGVMAGGIAHEIRTPLTISSSAAQFLMERDIIPEFRRQCAEKVHLGIQRASIIIENLLRFAHPSAKVDRTPLDFLHVLREAMTLIANQAKVRKVELRADLPERPVMILGIPGLLEQVFMNLFLNAMTAMPNGGTLAVSARETAGEVLVQVADTGHGVSKEDICNIFDPFCTKPSPGKGTGLGLSICYSIIEQHLGSIDVESEEGKGSVFTVRLPLM